jgi:hypothetical protein
MIYVLKMESFMVNVIAINSFETRSLTGFPRHKKHEVFKTKNMQAFE